MKARNGETDSDWSEPSDLVKTNAAPTIDDVDITSSPVLKTDTYGAGEKIRLTVEFSEAVTVTGKPHIEFSLGNPGDTRRVDALYESGSGTDSLVFAYTVVSSDEDNNGIFTHADALMVESGESIVSVGGVNADLDHSGDGTASDHKVDGSRSIVSVAVSSTPMLDTDTYGAGETIRFKVTFNVAVDVTGDPVFRFALGNSGTARDVDAAYEGGTGSTALVFGYTVVSSDDDNNGIYLKDEQDFNNPDGPVRLDSDDTIQFTGTSTDVPLYWQGRGTQSGHKVDGSRTTGNNAPVFTSSASLSVEENTDFATVVAVDNDADDDITGYAINGGTDQAFFSEVTSAGVLTFNEAPNFEDPKDSGTDNTYVVTVEATSGTGTREMTATQTITVTVTDADEKSAKPDKPTLAKVTGSSTTLTATWAEPDLDGGPAIAGYDLQYREGTTGTWEDFAHSDTAVTTTVTGLTADTSYQVQVRAKNGETDSDWSDASDAVKTNAEMTTTCTLNTGDLWCGVVTVERFSRPPLDLDGFGSGEGGDLSDTDFTYGSNSYTIDLAANERNNGALVFSLTSALTAEDRAALELHVDGNSASFAFSAAIYNSSAHNYTWTGTGLDWFGTSTVTLRLRGAPNNAPAFSPTSTTRTVEENSTAGTNVGAVIPEAMDADSGDTLTYSMEGTDAASFAFDASTRQITTITGVDYNYEATKNSYSVTVKASDGTDSGELAVTISLTDAAEKSATPAKPTLAAVPGSSTTLDATWEKPDLNGGPDIAGYAVQYRQTGGNWTNFAHSGTGVTTTITGLTANTSYQVRVQAKNGEGDSVWSDASDAVRTSAVDIPIPPGLEVTLHLSNDEPLESTERATVTATASPASPVPFTVTISASPVAPATEDDFTLSTNRVLSFAANATESTGTVTIRPVDDDAPEPPDVVTVSGVVSNTAIPDPDDVTLTIVNDDPEDFDVAVSAPAAVDEDAGMATVTVTLTTRKNIAPVVDVDLYYYWRQETATRGEDYTPPPGQVFASNVLFATVPTSAYSHNAAGTAWVAQRSFTIGIVDDREAEGDETIVFRVETSSDESPTHTIAIRDDDTPVLRNVRLVSGPGSDGVWSDGERVDVEVGYSLPVVVERPECWDNGDGTCRPPGPYMLVAFSSDARPGYGQSRGAPLAPYVGGSGTATLRFAYTVTVGEAEDGALGAWAGDSGMVPARRDDPSARGRGRRAVEVHEHAGDAGRRGEAGAGARGRRATRYG